MGEATPSSRRPWVDESLGLLSLMRLPFLPAFRFSLAYLDWGRELERKHRHQAAAMMARPTGTRTDGTTVCSAVSELISSAAGGMGGATQPDGPGPVHPRTGSQVESQSPHVESTDPAHTKIVNWACGSHRVHAVQTNVESMK